MIDWLTTTEAQGALCLFIITTAILVLWLLDYDEPVSEKPDPEEWP